LDLGLSGLGPSRLRLNRLRRRLDRLSGLGLGLLNRLGLERMRVVFQLLHPLVLLEEVLRLALLPLLPLEEAHKSGAGRQYIFLPPVQD
jgi:hypothetical protein